MSTFRRGADRALALAAALGLLAAAAPPPTDLSGTWVLQNYKPTRVPARERIPQTIEGAAPPLNEKAAKLYEERLAASDRGEPFQPPSARCLTNGMPLMMMADAGYPFQIVQSPGQVTMLFELWRDWRIIRLDAAHQTDLEPGYMGDSVGRWEGETLVVDTTGLNDATVLDMAGMPHSDKLRVSERIRLIDAETLEDLITIDDPETFTRPWSARMVYKITSGPLAESLCENNRDFPAAGD